MSIKVENYLKRLEDEILTRRTFHDGSTMLFADNLKRRELFPGFSKNEMEMATLPSGLRLYLKRFYCDDISSKEYIANEVIFSRLYNALGVNAIKYYPIIVNGDNGLGDETYGRDVASASQDMGMITGLGIEPFSFQRNFYKFIREYNFKIKEILAHQDELYINSKDKERERMLLANFIKTGLLDIICMMVDNHFGNKSVVRRERVSSAEDIISFDLEDSCIDLFNNSDYDNFKYEISHSKNIHIGKIKIDSDKSTYIEYLNKMRELLKDGLLPPECVDLFENIIKLNFDELLTMAESETGFIIPQYKKDFYKKLIDISQETFSR